MHCDANNQTNELDFDCSYRTSPRLMQDREPRWDCVSQMRLARKRPDVLASALRDMGVTESGDGIPDDE
jgi:hypothetical protein